MRPNNPPSPHRFPLRTQVYCIRHVKHNQKFACKTLGKKKLLSQLDADDIKREIEVGGVVYFINRDTREHRENGCRV